MLQGKRLQEVFKLYSENFAVEQGISKKTRKNRRNFILRLQKFLGDNPFTLETARAFIDSTRTTKEGKQTELSTVSTYIRNIRAFNQFLVNQEYEEKNFCQKILKPKIEPKQKDLVSEEVAEQAIILGTEVGKGDRRVSKKSKEEERAALRFVLRTGRRISEVLSLKGSDLNLDDDPPWYWAKEKGRTSPRGFLCPQDMVEELRLRKGKKKVFEVSQEACLLALRRGLRKMNIDKHITNHTLRDIFSISRLRKNVPLQQVSRLLGHKNTRVTDEYYSQYAMTDLLPALNTSRVIRHGLSIEEIFENTEKLVRENVFDDRLLIDVRKGKELVIRVKQK